MTIRLYMSMSLDGFVAGPDDRPGQEMGAGGFRLFNWLDERNGPGINGQVYAEAMATGAIISGRRTFELAGRWNGRRPLFANGDHGHELELVRRLEGNDATHLRYRVLEPR